MKLHADLLGQACFLRDMSAAATTALLSSAPSQPVPGVAEVGTVGTGALHGMRLARSAGWLPRRSRCHPDSNDGGASRGRGQIAGFAAQDGVDALTPDSQRSSSKTIA